MAIRTMMLAVGLSMTGAAAPAQDTPSAATAAAAPVTLAADLPVTIELVDAVSSKTAVNDDMFRIRLAADVTVDGVVILPAGTPGQGQVVHAAKARAMGKGGELILAARRIDCGGVAVPLRGMRLSVTGDQLPGAALAASMVVPFAGVLVSGGNREVPVGNRAAAKVAAPVTVTPGCGISTGDERK